MPTRPTRQSSLLSKPRRSPQTARPREPGEHRLSLIEERTGGREAIVHVGMMSLGGIMSPVPDEEVEVVIVQASPYELPARIDLLEGRPSCQRTEGDDVDAGHVESLEDCGIEVRGDEVGPEVFRQGQGGAFPPSDRFEEIAQDPALHDRFDLIVVAKLPARDESFVANAR